MRSREEIRYALVQLSHPLAFIEKLFTELNVIYGVESDLNMFSPWSQVVNWDCDIRCACDCDTQAVHPLAVGDERPD